MKMATSLKRREFSIKNNVKNNKLIQDETNQSTLSNEFSSSKSTVSNIWKNRSASLAAQEKKFFEDTLRRTEKENAEKAQLNGSPISGIEIIL